MDPLWLVPTAVLVLAVPVVAVVLRMLQSEVSELQRSMQRMHTDLRPALIPVRVESQRLRRRIQHQR